MNIPNGVIFMWAGNNADIPSGWERVTALDDKFLKGTASETNPNDTGGSATHTHSSSAHTHTLNAHTHTYTLPNATYYGSTGPGDGLINHTHSGTSGAVQSSSVGNTAVTYGAVSNNPPYYEVIFIKSDGSKGIPDDGIALYDYSSGELPADWADVVAMHDKYLKGAGTGANAGGTGGSTQNVHSIDHNHTQSHSHANSTSTATSASGAYLRSGSSAVEGNVAHSHTVSFNANTDALAYSGNLTTTETVEPAHTKLMAIQNQSGGYDLPLGIIGLWLGSLATIPKGWILCDGQNGTIDMRGRHLKIGTSAQVGATGGSNTHTHANQAHSHTQAHTHTAPNVTHDAIAFGVNSGSVQCVLSTNYHTPSVGNEDMVSSSSNTSADSSNNEPEYRTVAYIKMIGYASAGAFLLNMI